MPSFYCSLLTFVLLAACSKKQVSTLNTSNLESKFITIDPDSAYSFRTNKGARIKIQPGSFKTKKGSKVVIEIKEAFSIQDILLAGLATESDGRPLWSGGMIYFNATSEGKELAFAKPVSISIPSNIYSSDMQLFKGVVNADSSVNWVDPVPLDTSGPAQVILNGKNLFEANCSSCHKVFQDFTGPAMAGSFRRAPNKQWIYNFIHDPAYMIAKDAHGKALFRKWGPTVMTSFPNLEKAGVDAIYAYLENQERLYPDSIFSLPEKAPAPGDTTSWSDAPCGYDTVFYRKMDTVPPVIIESQSQFEIPDAGNNSLMEPEAMEGLRNGFTDPVGTRGMYDFNINTNGWYNIDAFVKGYEGTEKVKLSVSLENPGNADVSIYLFCPDKKMLSVGVQKKSNEFVFDKLDGSIPLFLNDKAIVLAFGSNSTQLYYGIKQFKVSRNNVHIIKLVPTTEEKLKALIKENAVDGIKIDTYKKDEFEIVKDPCGDPVASDTSRYY